MNSERRIKAQTGARRNELRRSIGVRVKRDEMNFFAGGRSAKSPSETGCGGFGAVFR